MTPETQVEQNETAQTAETETIESIPTSEELLDALQSENDHLRTRIDELAEAGRQQDELAQRLAQAEASSSELRQRYADTALTHAVDAAAVELGIAPRAAAVFRSRFVCEIDASGQAQITPDPADVLSAELAINPLLSQSVEHGRLDRSAAAVSAGATKVTEVNPIELMSALDRSASRKAQFITRHGTQTFIDLAEAARRKGYRR